MNTPIRFIAIFALVLLVSACGDKDAPPAPKNSASSTEEPATTSAPATTSPAASTPAVVATPVAPAAPAPAVVAPAVVATPAPETPAPAPAPAVAAPTGPAKCTDPIKSCPGGAVPTMDLTSCVQSCPGE